MKQPLYLLISILIILNLFLFHRNNKLDKSFKQKLEEVTYRGDYIWKEYKILKENENINRLLFIKDNNKLISNELKLVFRVNYNECKPCLDTLYKQIKSMRTIKNHVIFTTDIADFKKCLIDLNINNFHKERFFNYLELNPPTLLKNLNKSYFYIQNDRKDRFLFFLPNHDNPSRTEEYLNFLEEYIFTNKLL